MPHAGRHRAIPSGSHARRLQVLTGFPNLSKGTTYPGYTMRPCFRETVHTVPVTRVLLYPDHSASTVKRAFNYASFALSAIAGVVLNQRPDVVLAVYPPVTVGLPAWLLSRWWRVPLVLYVMDVWPDELQAAGVVSSRFIVNAIARIAMWGYRQGRSNHCHHAWLPDQSYRERHSRGRDRDHCPDGGHRTVQGS